MSVKSMLLAAGITVGLMSGAALAAGPEIVSGPGADPQCFVPWSDDVQYFQWPAKEGPYRIALAAQGTSNSWSALFDAHAFWYAEELGEDVISELLYADATASADVQVPQVEDLLAQDPDALILVPMGAAALSAPVERAMAQGVPVIL